MANKQLSLIVSVLNKTRGGFSRTLSGIKGFASKAGGFFRKMAKSVVVAMAAATAALVAFGLKAIKSGLEFNDIETKIDIVFGNLARNVRRISTKMANDFGMSVKEIRKSFADFQDLFTGFGGSIADSAKLTVAFVDMATALKAINPERSIGDITIALKGLSTGEFEAMKMLGVVIKATDLQKATFKKYGKEATKVQKAEVALALATEQSGNAFKARQARMKTASFMWQKLVSVAKNFTDVIGDQLVKGLGLAGSFESLAIKLEGFLGKLESTKAVEDWAATIRKKLDNLKANVKNIFDDYVSGKTEKLDKFIDDIKKKLIKVADEFGKAVGESMASGALAGIGKLFTGGGMKNPINWVKGAADVAAEGKSELDIQKKTGKRSDQIRYESDYAKKEADHFRELNRKRLKNQFENNPIYGDDEESKEAFKYKRRGPETKENEFSSQRYDPSYKDRVKEELNLKNQYRIDKNLLGMLAKPIIADTVNQFTGGKFGEYIKSTQKVFSIAEKAGEWRNLTDSKMVINANGLPEGPLNVRGMGSEGLTKLELLISEKLDELNKSVKDLSAK